MQTPDVNTASQLTWQEALDHLPIIAYALDDDARFVWVNEQARMVLTPPGVDLVGTPYLERVHEDDREGAIQRYDRLRRQQIRSYRADVRYLDASNRSLLLRVAIRRLEPPKPGSSAIYLAIAFNAGQADFSNAVLARNERLLRVALEASQAGVWDWNLQSDMVEYSQSFIDLLRYKGRDFYRDFLFRERLHADDRQRVLASVQAAIREGITFDETYRLLAFDGRHHWYHGRGQLVRDGVDGTPHFCGVLTAWDAQRSASLALERQSKRLSYQATHDPLTGLRNRRAWHEDVTARLRSGRTTGKRFAVMLIDLDGFKSVNDGLGHLIGDRLLAEVAFRIRKLLDERSFVARLGGDEFALCIGAETEPHDLKALATKLIERISMPWRARSGIDVAIGASIGIAVYPDDGKDAGALLAAADTALYRAKNEGRGVFRFYTTHMQKEARDKLRMESALRASIEREELSLRFQPVRQSQTGEVLAVEALLRWRSPLLGEVSPQQFVPLAEETGQMPAIGRWARQRAIGALARLRATVAPSLKLALNVSTTELTRPEFFDDLSVTLEAHGISGDALIVEITESVLLEQASTAQAQAEMLRSIGARLAIDDFGVGYSSLALLRRLRVDQLKIDRTFIDGIDRPDDDDHVICSAILSMARRLNLEVVAEGVERETQLVALRSLRCDAFQGFLDGGGPQTEDEVGRYIARISGRA